MQCPSCRADIPEESKFCDECGAALPGRCPSCGAAIRSGAKFCPACGKRLTASSSDPTAATSPIVLARASAERRHLTVMFCDLVNSTVLSARLDPEDMRDVIRLYHDVCAGVVKRFEGFVAKYMGDGVLVYFGYPHAHEDDAERAVRAGLALVETIGTTALPLPGEMKLQVRVGIATGLVVVGDLIGSGAAQEQAVVGETPNLAARLQGLAAPDTVVIAADTRRLTGGLFEYRDLGPATLKGFADPVRAWQVVGPSSIESRFEALHAASTSTPLIGRDEELDLLMRRWRQVKEGEGRVVQLSGEPGIGKSRVTEAMEERLSDEPHIRLRFFCSPYHGETALHPIVSQLEHAAGFKRDDNAERRLGKLEAILAPSTKDREQAIALLADLLSIGGDRYPPPNLSPQRRKEETLEALFAQAAGLAADRPVLMVFEDVHWIDPVSLELLEMTVERIPSLQMLLVISFRPEFQSPWTRDAHVTTLELNRLGRRHGAELVKCLTGNKQLPSAILDQITAHADGVPLFVEELTKAVLESGLISDAGDRYVLTGPVPPLAIPTTLNASLMARLDRLAPIREVAQIGAAIGREFSYELLAALVSLPEGALQEAVERLVHSELVFCRGRPPSATYTFKHALIRDAAYATLLRSRRQELHARIAKVVEDRFPETVDLHPEILAHHWSQAGLVEKAAVYAGRTWLRADGYQRRKQHLGAWEIGVSSYKLGNRYRCEVDNVSPGTRLARGEGSTRAEAEAQALNQARKLLAGTRVRS
ncbi:class 3 adenylate cyclase/predicted nucleic acid-binding Zn ribbon protein [Nitrobacteraceae bacterium AZCC 1564]